VLAVAATLAAVLIAFSGRYGYHRDELYFLACGRYLAWGYPDQPPLVPLIARLMSDLAPAFLVVLRLPSALASAVLVLLTGLIARELGAGRTAQALAAVCVALAPLVTGAGHLLSTTTFGLPAWALVSWLILRLLRTGSSRLWLAVGAATGVGLLDSDLIPPRGPLEQARRRQRRRTGCPGLGVLGAAQFLAGGLAAAAQRGMSARGGAALPVPQGS
jgi:Dolichyl-phosphate-mannose-protein mannosyltransferase